MTTENPWRDIAPPNSPARVNARRVSADMPWSFFWARGTDGSIFLTMTHARQSAPSASLPNLRGLELTLSPPDGTGSQTLAFRLLDPAQRDIFHTLCQDIISAASLADSESEAVSVALMRTWRWHHLLRGGNSAGLSAQEQMGLLGELFVLEHLLLPVMDAGDAVSAWRGPLGSPKDFEVGRLTIEAKAHRAGGGQLVSISSEDQLDETNVDMLFLHVLELSQAPTHASDGQSIRDVSDRVNKHLMSLNPIASDTFEALLLASGLRPEDDYSDARWVEGESHLYLVKDEFPRVTGGELRSGVSRVRYSVSLNDCEPFITPVDSLSDALMNMGGPHGN